MFTLTGIKFGVHRKLTFFLASHCLSTRFLTLFFLLFQLNYTFSQISSTQFSIDHYTEDDGLPQNSVKDIVKDESGFIWFTTEDGLVRYDGNSFKVFNKDNLLTKTNRFTVFDIDRNNKRLYTKNEDEEYFLIDNGNIIPVPLEGQEVPRDLVQITKKRRGAFWQNSLKDANYQLNNYTSVILSIHKGEFYDCYRNKVVFNSSSKSKSEILTNTPDLLSFFVLGGSLYYLGRNGEKMVFSPNGSASFKLLGDILSDPRWNLKVPSLRIWPDSKNNETVLLMIENRLYLGSKLRDGNINTRLLISGFDFIGNKIETLFFDKFSNVLWLGSEFKGLFKICPRNFTVLGMPKVGNTRPPYYYGQTQYTKRSILTPFGDILGFDERNKPVERAVSKLSDNQYVILTDSDGYIWVKADNGINIYDNSLEFIQHVAIKGEVTTLYEGPDGWIYVALRPHGVIRIHKLDRKRIILVNELKYITCFLLESKDTLLVGTSEGLYRVAIRTGNSVVVSGTSKFHIRSLFRSSSSNQIWITTDGDGFYHLIMDNITKLPLDKERYLASSHCIIEDARGFFWITTNKGLFQVSIKDLLSFVAKQTADVYYFFYDKHAGFNINEFNGGCQPCGLRGKDGTISFPSMSGIVFFNPDTMRYEFPDRKIFVDKLEIDNVSAPMMSKLALPFDFEQLKVFVSSPFFGNYKNIHISYSFTKNGVTPKWFQMDRDGVISVVRKESGIYKLSIELGTC